MSWTYTIREIASMAGGSIAEPSPSSVRGVSTDTRTLNKGALYVALRGEHFDGETFVDQALEKGAAAVLCTRDGNRGPRIIVEDTLAALQRMASAHRNSYTGPLLALTGSCGKTSTKEYVAALMGTKVAVAKTPGNLNNDIGCPLSLLEIGEDTGFAVIEMGANHAGEIRDLCAIARPTEAAITIVAAAHLEGFGTLDDVARAKGEIVEGLSPDGVYYVNADDPHCMRIGDGFKGEKVYFGQEGDVRLQRCRLTSEGEMELEIHPIGGLRVPLMCKAHATNIMLAVAVALRHGVTEFEAPLRHACGGLSRFKVFALGEFTIIDDTYNANPASMRAALESLAEFPGTGKRIAVLGEMLELGESTADLHQDLGYDAGRCGVTALFARGPHAAKVCEGALAGGVGAASVMDDYATIAARLLQIAEPGDAILFKGSRGMRMERVIDCLREELERTATCIAPVKED